MHSGTHRHFLLCKMSPMLDLKRRPQTPYGGVGGFRGRGSLAFLFALFVSSICLLVFSKDVVFSSTTPLQLVLSTASVSQLTGSISVLSNVFLS